MQRLASRVSTGTTPVEEQQERTCASAKSERSDAAIAGSAVLVIAFMASVRVFATAGRESRVG